MYSCIDLLNVTCGGVPTAHATGLNKTFKK